jgi:hypothetical protein
MSLLPSVAEMVATFDFHRKRMTSTIGEARKSTTLASFNIIFVQVDLAIQSTAAQSSARIVESPQSIEFEEILNV